MRCRPAVVRIRARRSTSPLVRPRGEPLPAVDAVLTENQPLSLVSTKIVDPASRAPMVSIKDFNPSSTLNSVRTRSADQFAYHCSAFARGVGNHDCNHPGLSLISASLKLGSGGAHGT